MICKPIFLLVPALGAALAQEAPALPPDVPAVPLSPPAGSELAHAARATAARQDFKTQIEL